MVFHFEWCTKYRHEVFWNQRYKILCEAALLTAAERHKINLLNFAVMPNHLHVLADIPFTMSVAEALQLLKGYTSYVLSKVFPEMKERYFWGCEGMWSPGKFVRTVGDVDIKKTMEYITNQPKHHGLA
jgi:putative transposase